MTRKLAREIDTRLRKIIAESLADDLADDKEIAEDIGSTAADVKNWRIERCSPQAAYVLVLAMRYPRVRQFIADNLEISRPARSVSEIERMIPGYNA